MAETRKYQPGSGPVGDAVRAALGETVRPVAPGACAAAARTNQEEPATTVRTFTFQRQTGRPAPAKTDES